MLSSVQAFFLGDIWPENAHLRGSQYTINYHTNGLESSASDQDTVCEGAAILWYILLSLIFILTTTTFFCIYALILYTSAKIVGAIEDNIQNLHPTLKVVVHIICFPLTILAWLGMGLVLCIQKCHHSANKADGYEAMMRKLTASPSVISSEIESLGITNLDTLNIPEDLCDPISSQLLTRPVITAAGSTYNLDTISAWFELRNSDPLTNLSLTSKQKKLFPNKNIENQVLTFLRKTKEPHDDTLQNSNTTLNNIVNYLKNKFRLTN